MGSQVVLHHILSIQGLGRASKDDSVSGILPLGINQNSTKIEPVIEQHILNPILILI